MQKQRSRDRNGKTDHSKSIATAGLISSSVAMFIAAISASQVPGELALFVDFDLGFTCSRAGGGIILHQHGRDQCLLMPV